MTPVSAPSAPPAVLFDRASLAHLMSLTMLFRDPPDHTRLRTLFNRAFTPRR